MPKIEKEDYEFIHKALDANYVNEGKLVSQFENKIANLLNVKYAIAVTSGTMAIFLALKSAGIGYGDEVIIPDITFIATANAVNLCGAKPVLTDVNPLNLNINIEAIKRVLTSRTKAIIPVHVSGRAADMESILKIAKKNNLYVIEDAAEAFTSKHKEKYLGTFGDAGCFSFSSNKTISTGQGGMLVTNNEEIYNRAVALKDQGRYSRGTGGNDIHNTIGYNFKLTDLQAALGLGQIVHLEERRKRMQKNYQLYAENLHRVKKIFIFKTDIKNGELPQWTDALTKQRDELCEYLKKQNIDCRKYWFPIHKQLAYKLPDKNFTNSVNLSPKALWLPSAFTLKDEDILTVCEKITNFFSKNN